jgi:hypothetical protein
LPSYTGSSMRAARQHFARRRVVDNSARYLSLVVRFHILCLVLHSRSVYRNRSAGSLLNAFPVRIFKYCRMQKPFYLNFKSATERHFYFYYFGDI